jgi:hypothetical protein
MSEHDSDGKVTTTHGGRQIFWLGHLCEGKPLVPGLPETFALRTRCGLYHVPPGEATERQPTQVVTCAKCKKFEAPESPYRRRPVSADAGTIQPYQVRGASRCNKRTIASAPPHSWPAGPSELGIFCAIVRWGFIFTRLGAVGIIGFNIWSMIAAIVGVIMVFVL